MNSILLILWNAAEAEEKAGRLARAGHEVRCHSDQGGAELRKFKDAPPDAFVIDLGRLPSHGLAVATWFRQQKPTRSVPIVFIEGDPEKTRRVRKLIPDAVYTEWGRIRGALKKAIRHPPRSPVVPGTMDGYSGTPLPKKLGIRAGSIVALLGAPRGFERQLRALPEDVTLRRQARGKSGVILLFVKSRADLEKRFPPAARGLEEGGRLWIAWPKRASGVRSDLTQKDVRAFGLDAGYVDYKICAIDETWSGLCFTKRR